MSHSLLPPPTPAVEVVATLGDSIVGVRHVTNPRGGRISQRTRGMLAGAALLLATAAGAFAVSTVRAAEDATARAAWRAEGLSDWAFRGHLGSPWLDAAALLGGGLGLTLLVAGLARRRREGVSQTVSIGSARGVDFAAAGTRSPAHALVAPRPDGEGFELDLSGLTGEVQTPAGPIALDGAGPQRFAVTPSLHARVRAGHASFLVRAVDAPAALAAAPFTVERRLGAYLAGTAAAHLALWQLAQLVDPSAHAAVAEFDASEDISSYLAQVQRDQAAPEPPDPTTGAGGERLPGEQPALQLTEGATGGPTAEPDPGRREIARRSDVEARAREVAIERAATAGILGSTLVRDLVATPGLDAMTSGFDAIDRLGGQDGDGPGHPQGFGDGVTGVGPGAGGVPWGTVRSGGYRLVPGPGDRGEHYRPGGGPPGSIPTRKPNPPPTVGTPDVDGAIDASMIRRYVRRELPRIAYCYDRELLVDPSLGGSVRARFTIASNGRVVAAAASGVSTEVSRCVADVLSRITFPAMAGSAQITYPFTFRSGASQ